jgi:hypothetical protein
MILKGDLRIEIVKGAANYEGTEETLHHNTLLFYLS